MGDNLSIVELNGRYSYYDFPNLSEKIHKQADKIIRSNEMILNLQELTFIDPLAMISIVGACRHVYNLYKVHTLVQLPQGSAGSYMERAGFKDLQDSFISTTRKKNFADFLKTNPNIGVLRCFKSEKDIKPLNDEVERWLLQNQFSVEEVRGISIFISEMVQNVVQHSKSPQDGVLCVQSYKSQSGPFLAWAIGDSGRGIKQSFLDSGITDMASWSDSAAIRQVIEKGLSRYRDDPTRGNGLYSLHRAAMKRRASLYIHSSEGIYAKIFAHNQSRQKLERNIPHFMGTQIGFFISQH